MVGRVSFLEVVPENMRGGIIMLGLLFLIYILLIEYEIIDPLF